MTHLQRLSTILAAAGTLVAASAAAECPYEFATEWGSYGSGPGQMQIIYDAALTPDGGIVVADYRNHRIRKFDAEGTLLLTIGATGTGPGQLRYPISLAVDGSGNIFVTELVNFRVQRFDANGNFLNQWAVPVYGQYNDITSLAADASGNVYAPDPSDHVVRKYGPDGSVLATWTSEVAGWNMRRITIDENGILYGQRGEEYIKFNTDLVPISGLLTAHALGGFDVRGGRQYYPGSSEVPSVFEEGGAFLCSLGALGDGPGLLNDPGRVLPLPDGRVIVVDALVSKLVRFDPAAVPATPTTWGQVKATYR
jgi:NHL repeat-containing protein